MNTTPRKILGFRTPMEVFSELKANQIAGVALQAWAGPQNMHPALHAVLTAIQAQRHGQPPDSELSIAVGNLVRSLGEHNLAERIVSGVSATVPPSALSGLLDHLAWHTQDNGTEMHRTVERWLREGTDERRVAIALGVEEFYPFLEPSEMKSVFASLALRYPAVKERCEELVRSRGAASAA